MKDKVQMQKSFYLLVLLTVFFIYVGPCFAEDDGFKSLFDGQTLNGWKGEPELWRVENGAIVGESTDQNPISSNRFLVWDQGEVDDFIFRCQYRTSKSPKANSGIQFRSRLLEDGRMRGYQADIDGDGTYTGILYSEATGRGILCQRGERVTFTKEGQRQAESLADPKSFLESFDLQGWNQMEIEARGHHLIVRINGQVTSETFDYDPEGFDRSGQLGIQLHQGPPMKIEVKDVQLKRLPLADGQKKIVFVAGPDSHDRGSHEHFAGCQLLAKQLEAATIEGQINVLTTVYRNGWPSDPTAFDNADTVVAYCDGGRGHFLHRHGDDFTDVMDRGVGLAVLHYAVEVPPGKSGQRFLEWVGGYFETDWSVNPFWTADFQTIPDHPVTRGVKPFQLRDEWYYHMRFVESLKGVTPLLSALPPAETLNRPDGPHSNNPHVRQAVLEEKQPQHVAWVFERLEGRPDGKGRGFGFTGGHLHRMWKQDDVRKLVLNAIVWTANAEIPSSGILSKTPSDQELDENLSER